MVASVAEFEIFVPEGDSTSPSSVKMANAVAIELLNYHVQMEQELVQRLSSQSPEMAARICDSLLKMFTIGDVNPPLFANWEQRTEFTFDERVVQVLGYMVQLSGNDLADPEYLTRLKSKVGFGDDRVLRLATSKRAETRFQRLVRSEVALERNSLKDLVNLAKVYHPVAPARIQSAEARMAVVMGMIESGVTFKSALQRLRCQPVDALRLAVALWSFEPIKLPADVLYAQLSWQQRIQLLSFLDDFDFETLCEAMGNNRTAWKRFVHHIHLTSQSDFARRFPSVVAAAAVSLGQRYDMLAEGPVKSVINEQLEYVDITESGAMVFRTFASRVQTAVETQNFDDFRREIVRRPSYLFRNLGSLSHVCTEETQAEFLELAKQNLHRATAGNLLSLVQIDVNAEYRVIDSKGNTTVCEANYNPVIAQVQTLAEAEIRDRYALKGQVVPDDHLKSNVVPFLSTNAELDRGSRIPFQRSRYLYFFIHWVQKARRTDLDHSYVCFTDQWEASTIYFGNQANSFIRQSGDITNAPPPHGGTEYGQIDLRSIPKSVRYIVPIVNVYSGDVFSENAEAYAGFQFTDRAEFSLQQKHVRYDLNQPAQSNIPFVIDVSRRELLVVDFNNRNRNGLTAHDSIGEIRQLISAVSSKRFMTIGWFSELLSGPHPGVSLRIRSNAGKKGECAPADLHTLVATERKSTSVGV